ncbi:Cysteine-rich repeat secretory protein [Melia azedarach]|uniref:Cysteine-rich repeat secretory protein n=1 Tax=Melia azedarach TaxID=155640 RepID=A0ACC1Z2Y9_MELAZ|nr:Cysteine-rich repeat secretory protein [Melia azedarach]
MLHCLSFNPPSFAVMSSSKFSSSLYLLTFVFLLQTGFGVGSIFHICTSSENNTGADDLYEANWNKLMGYLYCQAPPTGFGKGNLGESPNPANYGLALCRGDVSVSDCKTCVVDASVEIQKSCPNNKAAIIWYDNCLLKYSDKDFFGQIDNSNKFYMWNLQSVSNPGLFNQKTKTMLSQLANKAYISPKMYAVGETELGDSKKLYGLTQCTRDLSANDCKKCLDGIIAELPRCCAGKEGGRVISGSCNFRYEMYPIVSE